LSSFIDVNISLSFSYFSGILQLGSWT
jgi:hypothetical protein